MNRYVLVYFLALAVVVLFGGPAKAQSKIIEGASVYDALPPPGALQPRFTAGLNSMQVVPANDSTARGNCIIKVYNPYILDVTCKYSGLSSDLISADIRFGRVGQNTSPSICGPLFSGGTSGTFSSRCTINNPWFPATTILPAKFAYIDFRTLYYPNGEIRGQIKAITLDSDVDGDGRMDAFIYRPSDACSYTLCSVNDTMMSHQFTGDPNDSIPFLADFDGDGIADHSFIRTDPKNSEITTVYVGSKDNTAQQVRWGNAALGDQPVFGDYDGDGKMDVAVFRPVEGLWYILKSSDNEPRYEFWGMNGDRSCAGDYDKDGKTDLCVVRNENGQLAWYIRRSSDDQFYKIDWGLKTDTIFLGNPVDLDADGANDILVMRVEDGQRVFYGLRSSDNSMFVLQWGLLGDSSRLGDFDGDGKTDFGALRTIDDQLVWFISQSSSGKMRVIYWGKAEDQ